jgi:flagella basal body P-ring formation protein FlgA
LLQDEVEATAVVRLKQIPVTDKKIKPALYTIAASEQKPVVKNILRKRIVKSFDYVVLREPATKGTILGDLKYLTTKSFQHKIRGGYTKTEQIIGRKLKASMPEGKPLLARHLATVYIVEKNDIVKLYINRNGINISTEGTALSNGQLGETILVSNVDTGVKLKAKIKNSHEAEIITKQSK